MPAHGRIWQTTLLAAAVLVAATAPSLAAVSAPAPIRLALTDVRWADHDGFARVVLEFQPLDGEPADECSPRFTMRYRRYPYRLEIDLFDVAGLAPGFPWPPANRSRLVTAVSVFPHLPEMAHVRAVVCLTSDTRYEFRAFPGPCRLVIDLRPSRAAAVPPAAWVVRLNADWSDWARLERSGVDVSWLSLVPDEAGEVAVEAGTFADAAAAERRAAALAVLGISATVANRAAADLPAPLRSPGTGCGD